jgi:predicted DNA-binding transcriptional regulator YafY
LDKTLHKYIGHIVEIIYQGSDGQITQRRIEVHAIVGGVVKAYCLELKAPQLFRIENILAMQPVHQGARTS